MFIDYFFVLNHEGYAVLTKYKSEIAALPIVGEPIKNFYNEISPFINFAGQRNDLNQVLLIENNNLLAFSEQEMLSKTLETAKDFMGLVKASGCIDLLASNDHFFPSIFEETLKALLTLEPTFGANETVEFSAKQYQKLHNQLQVLSAGTTEALFFNKILSGINTILMLNNLIIPSDNIHLHTYIDENEIEHFDYSKARSSFRKLRANHPIKQNPYKI